MGENKRRTGCPDATASANGSYAHIRVYDPAIQTLSELADIQADRATGEPRMVRTIVPDKMTALIARERTGEGRHVRLAMLDATISCLWPEGMSALSWADREADPARGQMGLDLVFKTADGHITAGAVTDAEWAGLCRALRREDLLADPRFETPALRFANVAERRAIMSAEIAKWPSAEILARLDAEQAPSAPALRRREPPGDPQVVENGIVELHDDPVLGPVRQPRPAARFDRTPAGGALAPFPGAHDADILAELGYGRAAIAAFAARGVTAAQEQTP